jgi:plasmid stabilization system protein ParE
MGAFQIVFSPHSERDLDKIIRYISRDNPDAAERLGIKLINRAYGLRLKV